MSSAATPSRPSGGRRARRLVVGLSFLALLGAAGCSGSDDDNGSDTDTTAEGSSDDASSSVRDIEHALGVAEDVPAQPTRVVALDPYFSLPTAALGDVEIVGTSHLPFGDPHPPFVNAARVEGTENVGWFTELDIAGIHALEPDLIVGVESFVEPVHDELSAIAPTVALPLDHANWEETVRLAADAMGISEAVEVALADYAARTEEMAARLADTGVTDEPVTVLQFRSVEDIRVYTDHCSTRVLGDLGFTLQGADETPEGENALQVGAEQLTQADSSFVFYLIGAAGSNPEDAEAAFDTVSAQPLWERLGAVERGDTAVVSTDWWFNCGSPQANQLILDDVETTLLGQ
ncbi:iron-siderophore ABC transporter substrate-binding protein [Streptomyces profundus]|uniref:iron-siderophore ABC transporter substrate-binding protein n=1 Tax=Streptomyces profundus TaxID=2867410 RepID=UPI001D16DED3|nr:iron-siderophore ABC transporter substrate-binding protein [Streptomyces sp. MA3_2.13]UED85949.1 iron-siderophore ABC transporter substrate-binding protein [Streptomyces sp. MA3_2.13]